MFVSSSHSSWFGDQAAQTYRCHQCGKWHIGGSRPAYVVHSTQNFKRRRREAAEEAKD